MADSLQPLALPSFATTADSDPYGYYDRLREQGDAVWDEKLHAWLVENALNNLADTLLHLHVTPSILIRPS